MLRNPRAAFLRWLWCSPTIVATAFLIAWTILAETVASANSGDDSSSAQESVETDRRIDENESSEFWQWLEENLESCDPECETSPGSGGGGGGSGGGHNGDPGFGDWPGPRVAPN